MSGRKLKIILRYTFQTARRRFTRVTRYHIAHTRQTVDLANHVQPPWWLRWPLKGDANDYLPEMPAERPLFVRMYRFRARASLQTTTLTHATASEPFAEAKTDRGRTKRLAAQQERLSRQDTSGEGGKASQRFRTTISVGIFCV